MARPRKDRERECLEQEIKSDEYRTLLGRLQREVPFLRRFSAWRDVVAFMREGTSRDPRKDEVLRPILAAHAADRDPRWRAILLVIFWPGLKSMCLRQRRLDPEPGELWANAVWRFLQVVCDLDLERRPDRLVQKLVNDTIWRLRGEYRRARERAAVEIPTDPRLLVDLAGGVEDAGLVGVDLHDEQAGQVARLRKHLEAGRISEADFHLLVGTRVYGNLLRECAEEVGLSYEAAKKRRQRAEAALRPFEERR